VFMGYAAVREPKEWPQYAGKGASYL